MKSKIMLVGGLFGFLSSLIVMAISYLGNVLISFPFFPFDVFDWLTRHLPGVVIDTTIRAMVSLISTFHLGPTDSTAKLTEQIQALVIVMVAGIILGLALAWVALNRPGELALTGLTGGILLWLATAAVELSMNLPLAQLLGGSIGLLVLFGLWGWLLACGLDRVISTYMRLPVQTVDPANYGKDELDQSNSIAEMEKTGDTQPEKDDFAESLNRSITRRNLFFFAAASLASLGVLIVSLINFRRAAGSANSSTLARPDIVAQSGWPPDVANAGAQDSTNAQKLAQAFHYGPETTSGPGASPALDALAGRIQAAPGTREEITQGDLFYRIDINTRIPEINGDSWRLVIKGLVQTPLSINLAEIRSMPSITQAVTLSCISNPVGGGLIGTNYWTGVRFKDVLVEVGLQPGVIEIKITGQDGFYEGVSLADAMDERTLLVYAINGAPLAPEHGFPLRIYIPGHYGMKQPKWIIQMEAVDHTTAGYWEERGWSYLAVPKTTSVIDTINVDKATINQNGMTPLGGIAWAGARGIEKVEVLIDQGAWVEAQLRTPAISPLTWVQWRYDWKVTPGSHTVTVRATDGAGKLQDNQPRDPGPEGATGYNSVEIRI